MDKLWMKDPEQWIQILDSLKLHEEIKPSDMPEYKLYISQLEEFLGKKLGRVPGDEEEHKTISKTMIQNYIKDGLLMPPEGKCYNRNHVILLILIYHLKPVLSIKDIKKLLNPILMDVDDEGNSAEVEHLYNTYLKLRENSLQDFQRSLAADIKRIGAQPKPESTLEGEWDKRRLLLLIAVLISQANAKKRLAEHLIDRFFQEDDLEEGI